MRRRRKRQVAWLPVLGQGDQSARSFLESTLNILTGGVVNTTVHSLLPDYSAEALTLPTLSDYEGSGYFLRRIVGKFWCGIDRDIGTAQNQYPEAAIVAAGLIVLRTDEGNGAPLAAATPDQYSPLGLHNVRDPWIWRRTWILGNEFAFSGGQGGISANGLYPYNNLEYGAGTFDGPHVDAKTRRRVGTEERLFLIVSTQELLNGLASNTNGLVRYGYEARYVATPLRIMGNRRNASR